MCQNMNIFYVSKASTFHCMPKLDNKIATILATQGHVIKHFRFLENYLRLKEKNEIFGENCPDVNFTLPGI